MLDIKALVRAYYMVYYTEISESCRNNVYPDMEVYRHQGFVDAVNHIGSEVPTQAPRTLEDWRISAEQAISNTTIKVENLKSLGAITAIIHDVGVKMIILFLPAAILINASQIFEIIPFNATIYYGTMIGIVIVLIFLKLQRTAIALYIAKMIAKIFYDYGFSEGIIFLTDKHELHTIDLNCPLKF